MTVYIDQPRWPAHGTVFAHLISDESVTELHDLARAAGLSPRAFDGDHYDVALGHWPAAVAAGAVVTDSADLARRLIASGLRLRKRKGERGLVRRRGVRLAVAGLVDIDVVLSTRPAPIDAVFAASVLVSDARGWLLLSHSVRRDEWGLPGGWCETGETPATTAVRETREETGVLLRGVPLSECGWARLTPLDDLSGIRPPRVLQQVFRAELGVPGPPASPQEAGTSAAEWVPADLAAARCSGHFWWHIVQRLLDAEV